MACAHCAAAASHSFAQRRSEAVRLRLVALALAQFVLSKLARDSVSAMPSAAAVGDSRASSSFVSPPSATSSTASRWPAPCATPSRRRRIGWVVEGRNAELLEAHPAIDHVIRAPRGWLKSPRAVLAPASRAAVAPLRRRDRPAVPHQKRHRRQAERRPASHRQSRRATAAS